jgi:hypothetical protein
MNARKNEPKNEQRCEDTSFPGGGECNGVTCYRAEPELARRNFLKRNFLKRKFRRPGLSEAELSSAPTRPRPRLYCLYCLVEKPNLVNPNEVPFRIANLRSPWLRLGN